MKKIAIIMGSDSDFPVVKAAADTLQELEIPFEVHVYSAHRTPEAVQAFVSAARQNGFGVIIAAAGKAAHLAGVLAAGTTLPVIGIPMKSSALDGMDALLSTVQMPPGIPVATVGPFPPARPRTPRRHLYGRDGCHRRRGQRGAFGSGDPRGERRCRRGEARGKARGGKTKGFGEESRH